MIKIYDRKSKKYYYEEQYGKEKLNFLYNNLLGRILLKLIFVNRYYSKINAIYNNSKLSKNKISKFTETYNIDLSEYDEKFENFNQFFKRKKNIKLNYENKDVIAPAESKLLVYKINENSKFKIKDSLYDVYELLQDNELANYYDNGLALVYRLSVNDYHRYCYVEDGIVEKTMKIKGKLHTVSSISNRYKIFKENQREYQVIQTKNVGKIAQIEVGAMQIGKIVNYKNTMAVKGEEKGYFEYGGSTVIILYPQNVIKIDDDILKQSENCVETKVEYGEKVGEILC